jgi:general stress protein 26
VLERLPHEVVATIRKFRAAELTTLAKDGTPITWPLCGLFQPDKDRIVFSTSIGLPQKALNVQRSSKVSVLYSDPTGSGLKNPAHVLVQGDATVSDVTTWDDDLDELWQMLAVRQPPSKDFAEYRLARWLMDWYFIRLLIYVKPKKIRWWAGGDYASPAQTIESSSEREAADVE